jgi:hypothetical protein
MRILSLAGAALAASLATFSASAQNAARPLADIEESLAAQEGAAANAESAEKGPASEQADAGERAQLAAAVERGRLLYLLDRVAAAGTRDMLAQVEDPEAAGIAGFVIDPEEEGLEVIFYAEGAEGLEAVYRTVISGNRIAGQRFYPEGERPLLTPYQARLAAARAAAGRTNLRPCAQGAPFNVSVIPPEAEDAPIEVYLFTPQVRRGQFPAGGHYRAVLAPDGSLAETRPFASGCNILAAEGAVEGIATEALYLTHSLDPLPHEVHVFLSLWSGKPIIVGAGDRSWRVDGQGIRLEAASSN